MAFERISKAMLTASDMHVNRLSTQVSIAFIQDDMSFVAKRAFPMVPVANKSDAYSVFTSETWQRNSMGVRGVGGTANRVNFALDNTNTYSCKTYEEEFPVDDQVRANSDSSINIDRAAAQFLAQQALLNLEEVFATNFMSASVWTYDYDGVSSTPSTNEVLQWNDASSTPIEDVESGYKAIYKATGRRPNKFVIGYDVYSALKNHADIIARLNSGQTPGGPAIATAQDLAKIFDVDEVLVMGGVHATTVEGTASPTRAFIGGTDALLVYAAPAPALMQPSAGYTFVWTGLAGAGALGARILRYREESTHSDIFGIQMPFDAKVVAADLGAFWDGAVA